LIEIHFEAMTSQAPFSHLFSPIQIGKTELKNRVVMPETGVLELNEKGILISKDGKEAIIPAPDAVVITMCGRSTTMSPREGERIHVHYIGDCQKVGNAMDAIHSAFNLAVKL